MFQTSVLENHFAVLTSDLSHVFNTRKATRRSIHFCDKRVREEWGGGEGLSSSSHDVKAVSTRMQKTVTKLERRWWGAPSFILLQFDSPQQTVQAYNLVRSPITMQPGSHLLAQSRCNAHRRLTGYVEFSVVVE